MRRRPPAANPVALYPRRLALCPGIRQERHLNATQWSIKDAEKLYNVLGWGLGYFRVNADGHVAVLPDRTPERSVDLYRLADVVNVVGTSTCTLAIARQVDLIPGVCGVVKGSIHPDYFGIEAGLSASGDIFDGIARRSHQSLAELSKDLEAYQAGQSGLLRLTWDNGDRTVLVNPELGGVTLGWNLTHSAQDELFAAILGLPRPYADLGKPHLSEMTKAALEILGQNDKGFFLMVESANIDKQVHLAPFNDSVPGRPRRQRRPAAG